MAQVTGKVYISMNGKRIRSKEGASLDYGGIKRDAVMSDAGVDGFNEAFQAPKVECAVNHTPDVSLAEFAAFKDGTVLFETDTGSVYTVTGAFLTDPPKMSKGEVTLSFSGVECLEG